MKFRIGTPIYLFPWFWVSLAISCQRKPNNDANKKERFIQYLSNEYSEKPVVMGVAENGGLIEVLTSHKGNTLTLS